MTFDCPEQLAGVSSIEFYLLSETSGWPEVLTDLNAGSIVIDPEDNDVDGTIIPDSILINEKPREGEEGLLWPIDISFMYLYRGEPAEQLLEQYARKPGIAIACLNDGSQKLYGNDQEPVYLIYENEHGTRVDDRAGIQIRIRGEQSKRPVFYNTEA
jgi:hypothetical protein